MTGPDGKPASQLNELRTRVLDLAGEVNSCKARAGAALGGSVFLLLLGLGAVYDLARGNVNPWLVIGLDQQSLRLIAGALLFSGVLLLALGIFKLRPEARRLEGALAELEREYDERKDWE